MFPCSPFSIRGKSICPQFIFAVLLLLLVLQFLQFRLLWTNLEDSDGENKAGTKTLVEGQNIDRRKEEEEEETDRSNGASVPTFTAHFLQPIQVIVEKLLIHHSRSDSSGEYLIIDDVCGRFDGVCQTDSASSSTSSSSVLSLVTQCSVFNLYHLYDLSSFSSSSSLSSTPLPESPIWPGAISVAVFAPHFPDIGAAVRVIRALLRCGVDSSQVRFQLVTPRKYSLRGDPEKTLGKLSDEGDDNDDDDDGFLSNISCSQLMRHLKAKLSGNRNYAGDNSSSSPSSSSSIEYPVNLLRNVALSNAPSKYVLVIDVDMLPSSDLESRFEGFLDRISVNNTSDRSNNNNKVPKGRIAAALEKHDTLKGRPDKKVAFVIPAYEMNLLPPEVGEDRGFATVVPRNKKQLLDLKRRDGSVRPFYSQVCWKCQKYTDFDRWESTPEDESFGVVFTRRWADPWEPFFIAEKAEMPVYDERFKQYGFNRIQQVCELHIAGFEFQVLNSPFLLHLGFKENDRFHSKKQSENDRNRLLFRKFKQELKLKYPLSRERCY